MNDPHILAKVQYAKSTEELDGIKMGFEWQGKDVPREVTQAIAVRRAELTK